jgi:hypothetical protein
MSQPVAPEQIAVEILACRADPFYFIDRYCFIYEGSEDGGHWIPFSLWDEQIQALDTFHRSKRSIALKARQLGFSWLAVCLALWQMIFWPAATVLLFSKRDDEAIELLSFRMGGVFHRLPDWLSPDVTGDNSHGFSLANGSRAMAFPTTGGRSYTGTLAIVDEADYVPNLAGLLDAVKPTVDHGGKLILISTVDKARPMTAFKRIYQAARAGTNDWEPVFCSWSTRPERTPEWYEATKADILSRDGSLDKLWGEYPAKDTEALAPNTLDKRLPAAWLEQCYREIAPVPPEDVLPSAPSLPGLILYAQPVGGRRYVIGADPAEGNPTSDDSAATVLDILTGEEVAHFVGKYDPSIFAQYIGQVGRWYNTAPAMVERNNHGHAVLLGLQACGLTLLCGHDGHTGWLSSGKGKAIMYTNTADAFRNKETLLHDFETYSQLASIEGNTLSAPEGLHDDRATGYALAVCGVLACTGREINTLPVRRDESFIHSAPAGVFGGMGAPLEVDVDLEQESMKIPRW